MKMNRLYRLIAVFVLPVATSARAADDEFIPAPITVPDGYIVEIAAAPPLVKHPMLAGFDDRGRLFIAETAGENFTRENLEKKLPNFVRMIEDTDGDGVFDKSTIFADQLTYPMGALWHDGWLYVASSGAIWRFQDSDDDGVADIREQLVDKFGYTGNGADVHGCFLGPCGRLYWCEGRHGHEFRDDNGHVLSKGQAARIFSMQPDGRDVRVHCGGGMDNPVEIDFTARGEMLGTVNILYRQRGDCLVHWMHGGVYPRHDVPQIVAEFKRTSDLLPPVINLGHVAVSGTTRYRSTYLGADFQDNFFISLFNTHKVVRTKLTRTGSTFSAESLEFLSSTSSDFHPTDVLEDADGSLLVIDTGGWFLSGCPTSQIAKPNIFGAIYRIRRNGAEAVVDPRGTQIDWPALTNIQAVKLLDDDRHVVRERAIRVLRRRGTSVPKALESVLGSGSVRARQNALWVLAGISSAQARATICQVLNSERDPQVLHAAAMCAGENFDQSALPLLIDLLDHADQSVSRETATVLGKIGDSQAVGPLLSWATHRELDRMQEHAFIYALIEINDRDATLAGLRSPDPRVQRAALSALDQMDDGSLTRAEVTSLIETNDSALRQTAIDVIARHPEWSADVVDIVQPLLETAEPSDEQLRPARTLLVAFAGNEQLQQYVGSTLAKSDTPLASRLALLHVVRDANLSKLPESWQRSLNTILSTNDTALLGPAIVAVDRNKSEMFDEVLRRIADDEKRPAMIRVRALAASRIGRELSNEMLQFLCEQITSDIPVTQRLIAAGVIGSSKLNSPQLRTIVEIVPSAGPLELSSLLEAFESNSDDEVGHDLIQSLDDSPGLANLSPSLLDRMFRGVSTEIREESAVIRKKLRANDQQQVKRLAALESEISGGDSGRGHAVFTGQRAACTACHQVQAEGGRIGPDLSTIGARRDTRDLLEAILYPSSSLARGFESFSIVTTEGKVFTGMILSETTDTIQLRTTEQREVTLRRDQIEELHPSTTSIMPAGLDRTMSVEDLKDLVAYLRSLQS